MNASGDFLQQQWPYVALTVLAGGLIVRARLVSDRIPAVWRASRSPGRRTPASWAWHAGWSTLVAAHGLALLFPRAVLAWNRVGWRLVVLEAITAAAGAVVMLLWLRALWRHVTGSGAGNGESRHRSRRTLAPSSLLLDLGDSVFLSLVALALASGLLLAAMYRWGSSWGAVTLTPYVASIARGSPAAALIEHLPPVARLHVSVTFAALAAFPFTRLAAAPVVALLRAATACVRPLGAARVRAAAWLRRGPASLVVAGAAGAVGRCGRRRRRHSAGDSGGGLAPDTAAPPRGLETKPGHETARDRAGRCRGGRRWWLARPGRVAHRRARGLRPGAADRVPAQGPRRRQRHRVPVLPLGRAHEPARRHPVGQRVHELPRLLDQADGRDPEVEGDDRSAAADRVGEGPQPARLRLLQSQPARRLRGRVPALPRRGRDHGSRAAGVAADDGLVSGLPPRRGARADQHASRASRRT